MKTAIPSVAALVLLTASSHAMVVTVCNMPYSPGQFTTFNDAKDFITHGDTIYVHGSNFSYGSVTIDKEITVIGTGHNPNKQLPMTSVFGEIQIYAHNVKLIGLTIDRIVGNSSQNVTVRKCRFLNSMNSTALQSYGYYWRIEGNIFDFQNYGDCIRLGGGYGHIIQHNVFATLGLKIGDVSGSLSDPSYILNNIFLAEGSTVALAYMSGLTIANNIFYGATPYYEYNISSCTIEKNLTYQCYDNNFYPTATFNALNLVDVNPQFLTFTLNVSNLFDYSQDFQLDPGSLGHNYGTDGTDIGVFGGLGPIFTMTGEPDIAEILTFTITSPTTIAPGGTLTISVTSKRIH